MFAVLDVMRGVSPQERYEVADIVQKLIGGAVTC